jgi:hypothetical protein
MGVRSRWVAFGILILSIGASVPATARQTTPGAAARPPLALRATCHGVGETAQLRVQIANTANRETAVVLGFTAPRDQTHVVDSLDVVAVRPATGADEDYVYVNGKYALVTNGAPWIVSLAAGKTYELELPLKDFISRLNYSSLDVSVAPGTRLVLNARPAGAQHTQVWTGQVDTRIDACE